MKNGNDESLGDGIERACSFFLEGSDLRVVSMDERTRFTFNQTF